MAAKKQTTDKPEPPKRTSKPAQGQDSREKQLMRLAYDLAEKQLRDGTASAAVISHFLKMSTKREALEQGILEKQKDLITAKTENLGKDKAIEGLTRDAIDAITKYRSSEKQ